MNATHIHLVLNHVAILGTIFSILLLLAGIARKNETISTIALTGFVMSALAAVAVFLTGEPAEDSVKHLAGVAKVIIENHEESAELSVWLVGILGAMSLAGLLFRKRNPMTKNIFIISLVAVSFIASATISYTGYLGGKIRHSEISGNAAIQGAGQGSQNGEQEENDKD